MQPPTPQLPELPQLIVREGGSHRTDGNTGSVAGPQDPRTVCVAHPFSKLCTKSSCIRKPSIMQPPTPQFIEPPQLVVREGGSHRMGGNAGSVAGPQDPRTLCLARRCHNNCTKSSFIRQPVIMQPPTPQRTGPSQLVVREGVP